jgi:hypothetical protein
MMLRAHIYLVRRSDATPGAIVDRFGSIGDRDIQLTTYDIAVEKPGFKTLLQKRVVLRVTEAVSLRMTLELGATSQSVTIEGQA